MLQRKTPVNDIELITQTMATETGKCHIETVNAIDYLCIPAENEYHYEVMFAFVKNCGIEPRKKSTVLYGLLVLETNIAKLANILRKDTKLFTDYALILTGIDHAIQTSSFRYKIEKKSALNVYEFTIETGSQTLQRLVSNDQLLKRNHTLCEIHPAEILRLTPSVRQEIISSINQHMKLFCDQQDSVKDFVGALPNRFITQPPVFENDILTIKFTYNLIAVLKPVLTYVEALILGDGTCKIAARVFTYPNFNETVNRKCDEAERRLARLSALQRIMLTLNDYDQINTSDTTSVKFDHNDATQILFRACQVANVRVIANKSALIFNYEDIFSLDDNALVSLRNSVLKLKQEYIAKYGTNQALLCLSEDQTRENEIINIIKANDVHAFNEYIKTHAIDVNQRFTLSDCAGGNMVMLAVTHDSEDILESLLNRHKAEFHKPAQYRSLSGMTPLYLAAHLGRTGALEMLINAGADCNLPLPPPEKKSGHENETQSHNFVGRRPIFAAAASGKAPAMQCLIHNNADFTTPLSAGPSKGMTVFATALIHVHVDVVKVLLHYDIDHTAKISTLPPLHTVQKAAKGLKKEKEAAAIIQLLKEENDCMKTMKTFFIDNPFIEKLRDYKFVTHQHRIYLSIPCTEKLTPYLITFLETYDINSFKHNDTTLLITKQCAKKLLAILDKRPDAWFDFVTFITKLGICIRSSSYECELEITTSDLTLTLNDPRYCGLEKFLAGDFVKRTGENKFQIPLRRITHMSTAEQLAWIAVFNSSILSYKKEYADITDYFASALSQCSNIGNNEIKGGRLSLKLNHRSAALAQSLLIQLHCVKAEGMLWVSIEDFMKLNTANRDLLANEIKLRHRIFEMLVMLSLRVGERKTDYCENDLIIKFSREAEAERYERLINTTQTLATRKGTSVSFNYTTVFTLNDDTLNTLGLAFDQDDQYLAQQSTLRGLMTRIVKLFEPEKSCWVIRDQALFTNNSALRTLALLQHLDLPGLVIETSPVVTARIDFRDITACTEIQLQQIEQAAIAVIRKNKCINEWLRKVNHLGVKSLTTLDGIEVSSADSRMMQILINRCSDMLTDPPYKNPAVVLCYRKLLKLEIETLEKLISAFMCEIETPETPAIKPAPSEPACLISQPEKAPPAPAPKIASPAQTAVHSQLFKRKQTGQPKKAHKPGLQKKSSDNNTPPTEKKRTLTKAERRAQAVPQQRPIDMSIATAPVRGGGSLYAQQSLNANPEQSAGIVIHTSRSQKVLSINRFFIGDGITNPSEEIKQCLEKLSISIACYDFYKDHPEFDTISLYDDIVKYLKNLGALSHLLRNTDEFNFLIRSFMQSNLELFATDNPLKETILAAARRGAELWRATEQSDSLLSICN